MDNAFTVEIREALYDLYELKDKGMDIDEAIECNVYQAETEIWTHPFHDGRKEELSAELSLFHLLIEMLAHISVPNPR